MATFTGTHTATHSIPLPPADALARWSNLDRQVQCRPEVATTERPGPGQLRLKLKEMKHGPTAFAGDYTLQFTTEGDVLRWRSLPGGNPKVEGEARFVAAAGGCTVQFRESVSVEMDVGALAAKMLRPIVETMMERGMRGFVERMLA